MSNRDEPPRILAHLKLLLSTGESRFIFSTKAIRNMTYIPRPQGSSVSSPVLSNSWAFQSGPPRLLTAKVSKTREALFCRTCQNFDGD